jgi:hypothetical protein
MGRRKRRRVRSVLKARASKQARVKLARMAAKALQRLRCWRETTLKECCLR